MATVRIEVTCPASEVQGLLQAVRTWDNARPEIHADIWAHIPELTVEEVAAIYSGLTPPLDPPVIIRNFVQKP